MPRIRSGVVASGGAGTTQEQVEDWVGAMDTDSSHLDFVYTDNGAGAGTVTATIKPGSVTDTEVAAANKDGAAGTASMRTLGTGATQALPGNHASTTNARTPTAHASTHLLGGSDPVLGIAKTYRLAADFTTSAQTAQTAISSDTLQPGTYKFFAQGAYTSTSVSTGGKVAANFDGTSTAQYYGVNISNTSTASFASGSQTWDVLQGNTGSVGSTSSLYPFTIHGTLVVSVAGVLTVRFAGAGSANNVSLKAGADLTVWQVAR